ncbi:MULTISPECIES: hypothetical protein [unclassified Methylobacterium]|uniref:hypothetical protein n=1 Tax=unclassified Methylobacterium TaxID=2615210 RepID=UPI001FBAF4DB|nr:MULTISPECIES: hypothetical protein [unclassified Methylobacterium]MCJ2093960.1 hypothetical protein [Methylobacterium sp. J-072]MCJ2142940.1 hypothetical protein [Methylobacterium sp. E-066]
MKQSKSAVVETRPDPSTEEQVLALNSLRRYTARRRPVSVKMTRDEDDTPRVGPAHSDHSGWAVRVNDASGGASVSFGQTQLRHLTRVAFGLPDTAESATNSMLSAVEAVRPENEIEGMLAVQMATTHQAAMQALGKACQTDNPEVAETMGNLANKLMRTYTQQVEALAKLRRGGEQTVRVEHVHVYQGGQAIVGNVTGRLPADAIFMLGLETGTGW